MSMPTVVIDRLFERLLATYGAQWEALWAGVTVNEVKSRWAHELQPWAHRLEAVAWALEHLPDKPPNLIAFKSLCRQAPLAEPLPLPEPPADPAQVLAAVQQMRSSTATHAYDGRSLAQACIDGLCQRAERGPLGRAQRDILASCLRMVPATDPRRRHPVVLRYVGAPEDAAA